LKTLFLSNNKFSSLPFSVTKLSRLEKLNIKSTNINIPNNLATTQDPKKIFLSFYLVSYQ